MLHVFFTFWRNIIAKTHNTKCHHEEEIIGVKCWYVFLLAVFDEI